MYDKNSETIFNSTRSFFLFLLVVLPTFLLAGNRPLVWNSINSIVLILFAVVLFSKSTRDLKEDFNNFKVLFLLASLFLLWSILQITVPQSVYNSLWGSMIFLPDYININRISINLYKSSENLLRLFCYFLTFYLFYAYEKETGKSKKLLDIIIYSTAFNLILSVLMSSYGFHTGHFIGNLMYVDSLTGTHVNKNTYGFYLSISVLILTVKFFTVYMKNKKFDYTNIRLMLINFRINYWLLLDLFLLLLMLIALFKTNSRSAVIIILTLLVINISIFLLKNKKILITMFSSLILFFLYLFNSHHTMSERFSYLASSFEERFLIYEKCLDIISHVWLLGVGLGNFSYVSDIFRDEKIAASQYFLTKLAHNTYLEIFIESGVIGATILFIMLLYLIRIIVTHVIVNKNNRYIGFVACNVLMLTIINSFIDFGIQMPSNAIIVSSILGVTYGVMTRGGHVKKY